MGRLFLRGMLASEHAATPHTQPTDVYASDLQTTTSTTAVDMPNMSITLTTGASKVLITASCRVQTSTNSAVLGVNLVVDGNTVFYAAATTPTNTVYEMIAITRVLSLSAGSHTIKLQWLITSGTAVVDVRSLQVVEFIY